MKRVIQIEVVSDVVCPWCYIGKRRLERALEQLKDQFDFTLTFLPFELNPGMPKEGVNQKSYLSQKFGGEERYRQITNHVTQLAKEEGLTFDYDKQITSPNTRDAHRIIWMARQDGKQALVKEAFLKAYFENGIDLSKKENLVAVAASAGLDKHKVQSLLETDDGAAEVEMIEQMSQQRGVSGVPFYIINNKYGISGAQPSEVFVKVLREIGEKPENVN
jgi:predicted DsbA family dithiol-disulfide isomerase